MNNTKKKLLVWERNYRQVVSKNDTQNTQCQSHASKLKTNISNDNSSSHLLKINISFFEHRGATTFNAALLHMPTTPVL